MHYNVILAFSQMRNCSLKVMMSWVYTDRCCINNGKQNAPKLSGWGMYWGDGHPETRCGPIFVVHTNNYAELVAVYNALKAGLDQGIRRLTIFTDSDYIVNIFNDYIHRWKRNDWCKSNGDRPSNLRIIMAIDRMLNDYQQVVFQHVPGHSDNYGNHMADKLAREGASKSQNNTGFCSFQFYDELACHVEKYFLHCQPYAMNEYGRMHLRGLMNALKGLNRRITDWNFFNRLNTFHGRTFSFSEFVIIAELACRNMNASCNYRRFPMVEYDDEVGNGRDRISNCLSHLLVDYYDEDWEHSDNALDEFMCFAGLWQNKYDKYGL